MPTYRDITIRLISQFDICQIPEYIPPAGDDHPQLQTDRVVSVYSPILPSSQFWIHYSIGSPHFEEGFYYFKLYLDDAHKISWGCGKDDEFNGKVVFILGDPDHNRGGEEGRLTENKALYFSGVGHGNGSTETRCKSHLELRVFRARRRTKILNELSACKPSGTGGVQSNMTQLQYAVAANMTKLRQFYKYALLDPPDKPFATFRYIFKTWAELDWLGVTADVDSDDESLTESSEQRSPAQRKKNGGDKDGREESAEQHSNGVKADKINTSIAPHEHLLTDTSFEWLRLNTGEKDSSNAKQNKSGGLHRVGHWLQRFASHGDPDADAHSWLE